LRILLVDPKAERAAVVERALHAAGYRAVARTTGTDNLLARVRDIQPDVVIVDMDAPSRDALDHLRSISRELPRPIVMFVDQSDAAMAAEAVRAGVSAFVVDGLSAKRIKPIIEVAIARFQIVQTLHTELERTKESLADRKLIERAKGVLMERRGLSEAQAYMALRKMAMNQNKRLAEVARSLIAVVDVLKN
jgi:response regulator NasT